MSTYDLIALALAQETYARNNPRPITLARKG
jgi:hypothetical protein